MSRFDDTLRDLSSRLSLPQKARARVLMEVAGDLEDLYRTYRERGLSEEEATERAREQADLSDDALRSLVEVHAGWPRRLTDRISERAGKRWESVLLALLVGTGLLLSGAVLKAAPMARVAGLPLAPVAMTAAVTFGLGLWKAHVLWIRRDHRLKGLYRGLDGMVASVVLQLFVAFVALGATALQASRQASLATGQAPMVTFSWLQGALALLIMSLGLALAGGLLWFVLVGKVASVERAEAATLLPQGVREEARYT